MEVELRLDQVVHHPDEDFYFMAHAKRFVMSAGGFSNVIGHMVEHLGGEVLHPGDLLSPK